ncbi:hypothetical protein [Candidatus Sneabacter namystus]|uniref:Uncharacterized protein n=1 Tax=Candidatus Sneabacter namystus TaxID=2601646 RepID=A0A5C0UII2_9RICK|nr:hypothetical protein [Candidatus Sneabacter namystus]QEK39421.1 hypothetical protein FZC37_00490 [Candidatus Sneabacter namystus]
MIDEFPRCRSSDKQNLTPTTPEHTQLAEERMRPVAAAAGAGAAAKVENTYIEVVLAGGDLRSSVRYSISQVLVDEKIFKEKYKKSIEERKEDSDKMEQKDIRKICVKDSIRDFEACMKDAIRRAEKKTNTVTTEEKDKAMLKFIAISFNGLKEGLKEIQTKYTQDTYLKEDIEHAEAVFQECQERKSSEVTGVKDLDDATTAILQRIFDPPW